MCADPPDEVAERDLDRPRIGLLPAEPRRFHEQILIKHKIRTFHTHGVMVMSYRVKAACQAGSGRYLWRSESARRVRLRRERTR